MNFKAVLEEFKSTPTKIFGWMNYGNYQFLKFFTVYIASLGVMFVFANTLLNAFTSPANDMIDSAVAITNMARNSGGTGIVIESNQTRSYVLTNSHVCRVIEAGGMVSGSAGAFMVSSYKHSLSHDLCMITVDGDLKVSTKLAAHGPTPYRSTAFIAGHPSLYPTIVTTGHFSGRETITVMTGIKACTTADFADPAKAIACLLMGGIPIVRSYDSVLVSATIMPGSSGSGVYNANKELSGVAFAGSGSLGYAWTVPFESVYNFLHKEQFELEAKKPTDLVNLFGNSGEKKNLDEAVFLKKLKEACSGPRKNEIRDLCALADMDMVWSK
jgi:S1-C subfamily serine protease